MVAHRASDILQNDFPIINEDASLERVLISIGSGTLLAVLATDSQGKLSGIYTSTDLARSICQMVPLSTSLKDVMVKNPIAVGPDTPLTECGELMQKLLCHYLPVVEGDKILGLISVYRFSEIMISDLKHQLFEYERLQSKLEMRENYLGIVSHDIRSPLSVINICCEYLLVESSPADTLTAQQRQFVERIANNSNRVLNMVREILDVTALAGGGSLTFSNVDVTEFMDEIAKDLRLLAEKKQITIHVSVPRPLFVQMDRKRMVQAIENLAINAIKFTSRGKNIYIGAEYLERGPEGWARFSVRDEGGGLPEESVKKIFNKFQQLDTGVTRDLGVGLGLSIVQQYVQSHHGEIVVDAGEGVGATFAVLVPGAALQAEISTRSPTTPVVLLVDDDADVREYYCDDFRMAGYTVIMAADGEDGLSMFRRHQPDIVISDIRMPKMDGFELLAAIRSEQPKMPVVLCSGFYPNLTNDLARSIFKADAMMEKPVLSERLISTVKRLLPNHTAIKAA